MTASTFDTLTAAARALALACLVTGCATMESRSRIGTFDDIAPLHAAAFAGTVPLIEQLLADGASVNAKAEDEVTPLHVAAAYGQVPAIMALLDAGANVNASTDHGITPLHEAAFGGHPAAVKVLLAAGASANATTNLGEGPLRVARQGMAAAEGSVAPYLEAIEILTAHGARSRVPFPFPRESLK